MEIIAEIFFEVYLELLFLIVPDKNFSKRQITAIKIFAVCAMLIFIALAFLGIVLIVDYGNMLGVIPISVAVFLSLAQIILGIVFYKRNH
ncbi:MAG: hypothetical protein IJ038_04475 [Clostridia bacterium]|nr:hypothetical protein [Clostridia bacterium]